MLATDNCVKRVNWQAQQIGSADHLFSERKLILGRHPLPASWPGEQLPVLLTGS